MTDVPAVDEGETEPTVPNEMLDWLENDYFAQQRAVSEPVR